MPQNPPAPSAGAPKFLTLSPVIPVVTLADAALACDLAQALLAGGVAVIEVTLRNAQGLKAIAAIARQVPQMLVGAGTVLNGEDLRAAADAGARFAASPGATAQLLAAGQKAPIAYLPAVSDPSEVMCALEHGYRYLKFFPASVAGGTDMLRVLAGPFPNISFCATGGISPQNAGCYLQLPNVCCVGGSWLAPADALARRDWARIQSLAAAAVALRSVPVR
ncbi:MAG: bifunctional 4-hydroxy-2-oxoglutarate aldolase/2-dehydro-3-deoxy-phosphogluconate aldolase [Proteobacteria bacterium]|nr:bifunctional 4-hydroxy-2-oxoglutarate aldolase/2-dehydro-3-deoxy-phosphogluconate aldolase [Pseudomonadota bacterium]